MPLRNYSLTHWRVKCDFNSQSNAALLKHMNRLVICTIQRWELKTVLFSWNWYSSQLANCHCRYLITNLYCLLHFSITYCSVGWHSFLPYLSNWDDFIHWQWKLLLFHSHITQFNKLLEPYTTRAPALQDIDKQKVWICTVMVTAVSQISLVVMLLFWLFLLLSRSLHQFNQF